MNEEEWRKFWKHLMKVAEEEQGDFYGLENWLEYEYDRWSAKKQYGED